MAEAARVASEPVRLKVPPHSVEAEQALLGGLMLDDDAWLRVADRVAAADFYRPAHRVVFEVMAELADRNEALDVITISEALSARALLEKAGGNAYLAELVEGSAGAANVHAYAGIVQEQATLRRLIGVAGEISEAAFLPEGRSSAEVLDYAEQQVFEISEGRLKESAPRHIGPLADAVADTLDRLAKYGSTVTGVASGFDDLDGITAGFQRSDLIIVAARPSMGKTALMVNMAEHAVMADGDEAESRASRLAGRRRGADLLDGAAGGSACHAHALLPRPHRPDAHANRQAARRRLAPLRQRPHPDQGSSALHRRHPRAHA